jgi:hypothetical protein
MPQHATIGRFIIDGRLVEENRNRRICQFPWATPFFSRRHRAAAFTGFDRSLAVAATWPCAIPRQQKPF